MARNTLLWIDLTVCESVDAAGSLSSQYHIVRVGSGGEIEAAITKCAPEVICFNFDTPTKEGMAVLQAIKGSYPSLPILMLTEYHSEALALWAMRARVWDLFVKPVVWRVLEATLEHLVSLRECDKKSRRIHYPQQQSNPVQSTEIQNEARRKRTQSSICYIEQNYGRKITLTDAAESCFLSPSAFSHVFRKEHGIPFSDYLLRYRLDRAAELLKTSYKSISEIACAVGFNDASYFTRTFRRIHGMTPKLIRMNNLTK